MTLAAAHLHPVYTIVPALVVGVWIVWYWFRLGREDVPHGRRRIRRISIFLMMLSLPVLVRALSYIDPQLQPREYTSVWLVAMLLVLMVAFTAGLDVLNTLRSLQKQQTDTMHEAAGELARVIAERKRLKQERTRGGGVEDEGDGL